MSGYIPGHGPVGPDSGERCAADFERLWDTSRENASARPEPSLEELKEDSSRLRRGER